MKKEQTNSSTSDFDRYKAAAVDWDRSQYKRNRAISFMMWGYSTLATIAIIALSITIYVMIPLKEKVPYLIRVDSSTGIAETLRDTDLQNATFTESEQTALNNYFLAKYVKAREGYNAALRYDNYDTVSVMSSPAVVSSYVEQVSSANSSSPVNVLGRNGLIEVKIKSISYPRTSGDDVAYVRFIRTVKNIKNNEERSEHLLATVNFEYVQAQMDNEARAINPLGFLVTAYQLTSEVL